MRHPTLLIPLFLLSALSHPTRAAETLVVPYNQNWKFVNPMGTNPANADADFESTWWLPEEQFASEYDGPSFDVTSPGTPQSVITNINRGNGPGPLGYENVDNFTSGNPLLLPFGGGPAITSLGTTLTRPNLNHRKGSYYRTTFATTQVLLKPVIRAMIDDGCVIFIDGIQVARLNLSLPDNDSLPAYNTFAFGDGTALQTPESTENTLYTCDLSIAGNQGTPGGLQANVINPVASLPPGPHTLAVFVCSFSATNSDQLMALQMTADDAGIAPEVSGITRNLNGTPTNQADDTFDFDVSVTPLSAGIHGWTSDSSQHPAGNYSQTYHFTGFPAMTTATVGFTDADIPSLSATLTVSPPPPPLWIGRNDLPGQTGPLFCTAETSAFWAQAGDETIQHNDGDGTEQEMRSTLITVPGGGARFAAILEFEESSATDNFEDSDTVEALLLLDDGFAVTEANLLPVGVDVDSSGKLNGYTGADYDDFPTRDEFNLSALPSAAAFTESLALYYDIPPGTVSARLVVRAANDASTETFRVRNALFTTATGPFDRDGDTILDTDELTAGTDPFDASSGLKVTSALTPGSVLLSFPSVSGRFYRVMSSEDLVTWSQENSGDISGDGNLLEYAVPNPSSRKFLSLQVRRGLQTWP